MPEIQIGDRYIYTAPSGKVAHYIVRATGLKGKDTRSGYVRMVAEEAGWPDATPHPSDLPQPWFTPDALAPASRDSASARRGRMTLRSLGVEFPVVDDPTKLHGLVGMEGFHGDVWRAECMACGYRSVPYMSPAAGRKRAIQHANSASHRVRLGLPQQTGEAR